MADKCFISNSYSNSLQIPGLLCFICFPVDNNWMGTYRAEAIQSGMTDYIECTLFLLYFAKFWNNCFCIEREETDTNAATSLSHLATF